MEFSDENCGFTLKSGKGCGRCDACFEEAAQDRRAFDVIDEKAEPNSNAWGIFTFSEKGFAVFKIIESSLSQYHLEVPSPGEFWVEKNHLIQAYAHKLEALERCEMAKAVERRLRPLWQAAIEHEMRIKNMMLEAVYATARGE